MADPDDELMRGFRALIASVRAAPRDPEPRRKLHALAGERDAWDTLVALLEDAVRAESRPVAAAALFKTLAQVHLHNGRAHEAETAYRKLRANAPDALDVREEAALVQQLADTYDLVLDQPFEAVAAVERLIELQPTRAGLHERLAGLCQRLGAWSKAAAAWEQFAALSEDDERAHAALLGAAAAYRDHGQYERAIELYRKVLAERPGDLTATTALEELIVVARATTQNELLSVDDAGGTPTPDLEPITGLYSALGGHRTVEAARAHAAAGELDEAHRLLLEAHRAHRHDLPITLALGLICFDKHLWREAALHLSGLAAHPDAPHHAAEVAVGLARAAQAEVRALRPERAESLYDQAVQLDPTCTIAWHALAEIAMEHDQVGRAAECLEREADATADAASRLRLYDALGDLSLRVLGDPVRAERCWIAAVTGAPRDDKHIPLLDKLLELQRSRHAGVERGDTCERLALLVPDARTRSERLLEAIDAFAAGGDRARARAAAERLADAQPLDEQAMWRVSELELADGDHEAAAARLGRALLAWDAAGKATPHAGPEPRRAELWRRLGDARRGRGDTRGAESAYSRAIALAPEADGATGARRGLLALGGANDRQTAALLAPLVQAEHTPDECLAYARTLARTASPTAADAETARAMFELARVLGASLDVADEGWLARHPARVLASDEAYASALDPAEHRALIDDAADAPLADELEACWEAAALLCPDPRTALERAGFADAERVSPVSPAAAPALYPQIAKLLGGPMTLLYAAKAKSAPELTLLLASPPVVVLGARLTSRRAQSRSDAEPLADAELRFRLGRIIELARPRRVFAAGAGALAFTRLIAGLWHAFGRAGADAVDKAVAAEADRLRTTLPVRLRGRLAERFRGIAAEDLDPMRYLAACERAADRAGLIACGHTGVAVELSGGASSAPHVVALAAQARYLAVRQRLRGGG